MKLEVSRKPNPLPRTHREPCDNATDEDGVEFYTTTTADESVFYLVIDKQKPARTPTFTLVTTDDLLPLLNRARNRPKK